MPAGAVDIHISASGGAAAAAEVLAVTNALKALKGGTTSLSVNTSGMSGAYREVQNINAAVGLMRGNMEQAARGLAQFGAGATAFGLLGGSIAKAAIDYQKLTTTIQNNTTMTNKDAQVMDRTIRGMAASAGGSLDDLAKGFMRVTNFGNDAADSAKILGVAYEAAVAKGAKVEVTSRTLAATMREFNIGTGDAAKTMNVLASASQMGNTTLEEFVDHTGKSMSTAANLGITLEDVSAAFVALTRHGFDAAQANTQITGLMTHIINPSKAAQAELKKLSDTTGIDLVTDFSLAGVQARTLAGVMEDVRNATRGNEDEILKLIPALRGGQGALALTGSGFEDLIQSSQRLHQAAAGEIDPVGDSFKRMQNTVGQQLAILRQHVTGAAIDLGQQMLPSINALVGGFNNIPAPLVKTTAEIALFVAAIKTMQGAGTALSGLFGSLGTGTGAMAAGLAETTAALVAERAAALADVAALDALNVARRGYGGVPSNVLGPGLAAEKRIAAGTSATSIAALEAQAAAQQSAIAAAFTKNTGMYTVIGFTIGAMIVKGIADAIDEARGVDIGSLTKKMADRFKNNTDTSQTVDVINQNLRQEIVDYKKQIDDLSQYTDGKAARLNTSLSTLFGLGDKIPGLGGAFADPLSPSKDRKKLAEEGVEQAQQALKNNIAQEAALKSLTEKEQFYFNEMRHGRTSIDEAERAVREFGGTLIIGGANADKVNDSLSAIASEFEQYKQHIVDTADAEEQAANIADEQNDSIRDRIALLRQLGVSESAIQADADTKDPGHKFGKSVADKAVAEYARAQKDADAFFKGLTKAADEAVKAVDAIDTTKGADGLLKGLAALQQAQRGLTAFGGSDAALNSLTAMAEAFGKVADQERLASTAYIGFTAQLAHTEGYVAQLDSFEGSLKKVADAAKDAKSKGLATPDQLELLKDEDAILGKIAEMQAQLKANEAGDILGMAKEMPNLIKFDNEFRDLVKQFGGNTGAKGFQLKLDLDTKQAVEGANGVKQITKALTETPDLIRLMIDDKGVQQDISDMHGDISLLTEHDWSVIVKALMGDSLTAVTTLKGILDAVPNEKNIKLTISNIDNTLAAMTKMQGVGNSGDNNKAERGSLVNERTAAENRVIKIRAELDTTVMDENVRAYQAGVQFKIVPDTTDADRKRSELTAPITTTDTIGIVDLASGVIAAIPRRIETTVVISTSGSVPSTPGDGRGSGAIPAFAEGTGGAPPGWAWVGEQGPELVRMRGGEQVKSHHASMRLASQMGNVPGFAGGTDDDTLDFTKGPNNPAYAFVNGKPAAALKETKKAAEEAAVAVKDLTAEAGLLAERFAQLDHVSLGQAIAQFGKLLAINTAAADQALKLATNGKATEAQTAEAHAAAVQKSAQGAIAFAQALHDAKNPANDLAADFDQIRATTGPIGENLVRQVSILREINVFTQKIKDDTRAIAQLDRDHTATLDERAKIDRAYSRAQQDAQTALAASQTIRDRGFQIESWQIEDANTRRQRGFEAQNRQRQEGVRLENEAWTRRSRTFDDSSRALDRQGTLRKRQLDDALAAIDKENVAATSANKLREQQFAAAAKGATNFGANQQAAMGLALAMEQDKKSADALVVQKAEIADLIKLEDRRAEDAKFNLETEKIAASRAHEDTLTRMALQAQRAQERFDLDNQQIADVAKARDRAHTQEQWQIQDAATRRTAAELAYQRDLEDTRQIEEDAFKVAKQTAEDQLASDQQHLTNLTDELADAQSLLDFWSSLQGAAADVGNTLLTAFSQIKGTEFQPIVVGKHAGGGRITTPWALVGEQGPEIIAAPGYDVMSAAATAAAMAGGKGGGPLNVTIVQQPGESTDALFNRFKAWWASQQPQTPQQAYRSTGGMR